MKNIKKNITKKIKQLGFDVVGFTEPNVDKTTSKNYIKFLEKNHHGEMKWLERHLEKKINPKKIWNKVKTIVVLGINYSPKQNPLILNKDKKTANISVYAKNIDYHQVIREKLENFQKWLLENFEIESKSFVDTSPILEKYFAQNANIGWQGKHTNLVSKKYGSWLFLSEIFLPIELETNSYSSNNCGICKKCIDICPTGALYKNYKIDARKCISYLTIEHKGPFPLSLRKNIGNKIYGCDDCLAVCPWNKFSKATQNKDFLSTKREKTLDFFLSMGEKKFKKYFSKSPILRIGWVSFLRNVIIATGNSKSRKLSEKIYKFLNDDNPIIRGASIWSLFQLIGKNQKKRIKEKILKKEKNKYVLYELNITD